MNRLFVFLIVISYCFAVDIDCDEAKSSSNYQGPLCTLSGLNYTDSELDYTFKTRDIYDHRYYGYRKSVEFLTTFDVKNSQMTEIPRQMFQTYKNLEQLKIQNVGIEDLHRFTFENAKKMIKLDVSRNNITKLEKGAFNGATLLDSIDLSANQIEKIDEKAFTELANLKILVLSSNKLTEIAEKTFNVIKNLRKIKLDNNDLRELSGNIFLGNQQIREIDLNGNKLATFDLVLFDNMPNILKFVDVSYNVLNNFSISCQTFSYTYDTPENLYLNLSTNYLTDLDISTNFSVTHLYLGSNNLISLDPVSKLTHLVELDLSFNKIGRLEVTSLSNFTELTYLNLETTGISNIDYGTFSHQTRLITLDIAYNQLKHIDWSMFASLTELQSLYIDGNNLTSINHLDLFETFPKLGAIGLQDNQFNCTMLAKVISEFSRRNIRVDVTEDAKVTQRSNVKGIGCMKNEKDLNFWQLPVHHVHNSTASDDTKALSEKVNHLIDIVKALNASTQENVKLKQELRETKDRLVELTSNFYETKSSLISHQLSSLTNGSNLDQKEVKTMIEIMNNMTLDRQKLALDKVKQQLVELEFDVRKNSDKIETNNRYASFQKESSSAVASASTADHVFDTPTKFMICVIFMILTTFAMVKVVEYVRGRRHFRGNFRGRSNTQSTLHSTIEHSI